MRRRRQLAVRVGDVVTVAEGDYCFGLGRLVLRVLEVGRRERYSDGLWLHLRGVDLGRTAGVRPRQRRVIVRLGAVAVRRARRPAPPAPGTPEAHLPLRPGWHCAGCGQEWPCPDRRERLLAEWAGHRVGTAMLLSSYLLDALAELPGESPAALRARFLGWLPRRQP